MKRYSNFLRTLEALSNYDMIKACDAAGLEKIATGSSRVVYAINDKLVLKIALGKAGHEQNQNEMRVHYMLDYDFPGWKKYYAKMYPDLSHPRDMFIVMERLETKTNEIKQYCKDLEKLIINNRFNVPQPTGLNRRAVLHFNAVRQMDEHLIATNHEDMHPDNMGQSTNGNIKLLDFGLFKSTWRTHYHGSRKRVKKDFLHPYS